MGLRTGADGAGHVTSNSVDFFEKKPHSKANIRRVERQEKTAAKQRLKDTHANKERARHASPGSHVSTALLGSLILVGGLH